MRILITGASGLIGSELAPALEREGHAILKLVRRPRLAPDEIEWDPTRGRLDGRALAGIDAVVHLAGEDIAKRWTRARRARIRASRVRGTHLLAETLGRLERPPAVLISASAIGIYGDRGDEPLTEDSAPGTGFLAGVARSWEEATAPAAAAGVRVVTVRTGLVLTPKGGVLARLLPIFRAGLGGPIGRGRRWWSWITLDDLVAVYRGCLERGDLAGPLNAVAPHPVRNGEFARALGAALHRPAVFPVPPIVLTLAFGEMGREVLLSSARVTPARLERAGFEFRHARLEAALTAVLSRG